MPQFSLESFPILPHLHAGAQERLRTIFSGSWRGDTLTKLSESGWELRIDCKAIFHNRGSPDKAASPLLSNGHQTVDSCRNQPLAQPHLQPMGTIQMLFSGDAGGGKTWFLSDSNVSFWWISDALLNIDSLWVIQLHPFYWCETNRNHYLRYCYPATSGGIQGLGSHRTSCSWSLKAPFQSWGSSGWPTESPFCIAGPLDNADSLLW